MRESSSINIELITNKLPVPRSSNASIGPTHCIYRADERIHKMNEDAYTPDTVSIGPYHLEKRNLQIQAMEDLKSQYVAALLVRTSHRTSLKNYVEALGDLETEARGFYSEPINLSSREEFIGMMLFDGLFIIELFRKYAHIVKPDDDDPIFSSILRRTRVVRDLALLENQIPMSVLQRLFDLSKDPISDPAISLTELALYFFEVLTDGMYMYPEHPDAINTHKHLLDLLNNTFDGSLPAIASPELIEPLEYLPCVMELMRSGVKFEKRDPDYLMNIEFNKGTFRIPPLCVNDYTDSFFRNLMAYEQQRSGTTGRYYVTSYVLLMDSLIDSADDVKFLRGSEIFVNLLGDDSKVSSLFNNLCNGISTKKSCYGDLYYRVREYYNRPCNKWKATFRRDYCNSPWTIISVGAAILLLFLTIWATMFTTLPVFNVNFKH